MQPIRGDNGSKRLQTSPKPQHSKLSLIPQTPLLHPHPSSDRDVPPTHRLRHRQARTRPCFHSCSAPVLFLDRPQYVILNPQWPDPTSPDLRRFPPPPKSIGSRHDQFMNRQLKITLDELTTNAKCLSIGNEKKWAVEKEGKILSFDG